MLPATAKAMSQAIAKVMVSATVTLLVLTAMSPTANAKLSKPLATAMPLATAKPILSVSDAKTSKSDGLSGMRNGKH
jgi:hypothetical protein